MKITEVYIKNFRSIEEARLFPGPLMCLVGENNAGKSNILRAIDFVLGESWPTDISKENIYQFNEDLAVEIKIYFELTEDEHNEINKFRKYPQSSKVIGIKFEKKERTEDSSVKRSENVQLKIITNHANEQYRLEYLSTEIKQFLSITYIGANRDIERHLGYSSKWTFMSKLADRFEQELDKMEKQAQENGEISLKSKIQTTFQQVEAQFKEVGKFKQFDDSLQEYFSEHLPNDAEERRFDISVSFKAYNPISYFKSLSLIPKSDGKEIDLSQLGDGLKTILLISYFKAYAEAFKNGSILMIEEPEIYLHPHLRRHIYDLFVELSEKYGIQIFFTTHSPDFVDVSRFENIFIARKHEGKTVIKQSMYKDGGTENNNIFHWVSSSQSILGTTSISKTSIAERLRLFYRLEQNEAFFAKKIVLVEGQSEFFSLPIYSQALGKSFHKEGITVVNCGSKNNIHYFYHLFRNCLEIPTFVMFDGDKAKVLNSDASKKQDPKWNRYFQEMLRIEGGHNDIFDSDKICEDYAIFSEDFETFMENECHGINDINYSDIVSEAKNLYGGKSDAKWFIQKYVANKLTKHEEFLKDQNFKNIKLIIQYIFKR